MRIVSFLSRITDTILPRQCVSCGCRLSICEDTLCASCRMSLPRTGFAGDMYCNDMAKLYYGLADIERSAAYMFFVPHSDSAQVIYQFKYFDKPEYAVSMGRIMAQEIMPSGFFDGMDVIVPVPLSASRKRKRGYNQSHMLAQGVAEITGLPVEDRVLCRDSFLQSQTILFGIQRRMNVEGAFKAENTHLVENKHILLIDDVVTTGATTLECATKLLEISGTKVSVLSLGYSRH